MVEMTTSHKQPALLVLFVKHSDSVAIATDAHQLNTMLFIDGRWKDFAAKNPSKYGRGLRKPCYL